MFFQLLSLFDLTAASAVLECEGILMTTIRITMSTCQLLSHCFVVIYYNMFCSYTGQAKNGEKRGKNGLCLLYTVLPIVHLE